MTRKSPAFSFYPDSWVGGTSLMTDAQRGVYIQLLAMNWLHGSLSFCHALAITFARDEAMVLGILRSKFVQDENGNWYNERLEEERKKQQARSESGQKGAKKRWGEGDDSEVDGKPHGKPHGETNGKPDDETMHSDSVSDSVLSSGSVSNSKKRKKSLPVISKPDGVDQQSWDDWIVVRSRKGSKHPTASVMRKMERESATAGITLAEAIAAAAENEWAGFQATWYRERVPEKVGRLPTPEERAVWRP